jgi:hypothetical protein
MLKKLIFAVAISIAAYTPTPIHAQQLIGSYVALLSEADHFNSDGQRLTSAAAIIRQDRANFHRFGIRDPEDEDDTFFADEGNRAALEQMLERGRADPGVISRIVNGAVLIRVDIYRGANGPFIQVTLLDRRQSSGSPKRDGDIKDYAGPFTTEFLYAMCTQNDTLSREKCDLYLQGLLYGLNTQKSMQQKGMSVCLPEMTPETARLRILKFIDDTTAGDPSNNKDGGDWMAYMGVAVGNFCK